MLLTTGAGAAAAIPAYAASRVDPLRGIASAIDDSVRGNRISSMKVIKGNLFWDINS
jgi:hypothetical protein